MPIKALQIAGIGVVTALALTLQYGNFGWCDQNETCFIYDLTSGQPVAAEHNPREPFGFMYAFGTQKKFFRVSSEVNTWSFSKKSTPDSPFDEAASWDSGEGVTMIADYTIFGQVTDPWLFYNSFSKVEGDYSSLTGIKDARIYEALRQAGDFVDARMGELTQVVGAEDIRRAPATYSAKLTDDVAVYMSKFGFTITGVRFPKRFEFPGGNIIAAARDKLNSVTTEIEEAKQEKANADAEAAEALSEAAITGDRLVAEANRYAASLGSDTSAQVDRLSKLIESGGGVDGMLALEMARVQADLARNGSLATVHLTGESILGRSLYATVPEGDSGQ